MTITVLVLNPGMHQNFGTVGDMRPEHVETVAGNDNYQGPYNQTTAPQITK